MMGRAALRWLAILLLLLPAASIAGCLTRGGDPVSPPEPQPVVASTPTLSIRYTPPPTAAPLPTVAAMATVGSPIAPQASPTAALPPPTPAEAEAIVREYFRALDADDYEAARATTVGSARERTDDLIYDIQTESEAEGVSVDLRVPELQARPDAPQKNLEIVRADFLVQVYAGFGPLMVKYDETRSDARFHVARLAEGIKIVEIDGKFTEENA